MIGRGAVLLVATLALSSCGGETPQTVPTSGGQQGVVIARPENVRPTPPMPSRFGSIGRSTTSAEVRAWNIDVNGSGVGLPSGRGTYDAGAKLFATQCAACHGPKGEGIAPFPRLIGAEPRDFSFARDFRLPRTIGNYWPYATTLYDYINRAMPFTAPGSLKPDDVYSLVAFLLSENQVIDRSVVMDRRSLPKVRMPARDRFVPDNRAGGARFR